MGGCIIFTSQARVDRHIYVDPSANHNSDKIQENQNNILNYQYSLINGSHTDRNKYIDLLVLLK
jgi:hypothetical protein